MELNSIGGSVSIVIYAALFYLIRILTEVPSVRRAM